MICSRPFNCKQAFQPSRHNVFHAYELFILIYNDKSSCKCMKHHSLKKKEKFFNHSEVFHSLEH